MKSSVLTIAKKELARFFSNKASALIAIVLPGLLIFGMWSIMGNAMSGMMGGGDSERPTIAVVCPLVNTGIFCLGAVAVFKPLLLSWAAAWGEQTGRGAVDLVTYVFLGLIGLNFLIELAVNVVLSPVVVRILKARLQ